MVAVRGKVCEVLAGCVCQRHFEPTSDTLRQMQWREVDLDTGWWLIPGNVSKNHDPHRVPLTSMVLEVLDRRARAEDADNRYVFSNRRHTCVADRAKKAAGILCKGRNSHLRRYRYDKEKRAARRGLPSS
jgi:integrase